MGQKKNIEQKKNIGNIILNILIICLLVFIIILIINKLKNPEKPQEFLGINIFTVISGSMEPKISIGDVIITKKANEIKEGDIIAFEHSNIITVHRVNKIAQENGKTLYQTKGDNNNTVDENLISRDNIIGVYFFKIPAMGKIQMFIYDNLVFCAILVAIIILIIILYKFIK